MAKRKASNNWRAQQLAAYKSLAVMAGNVGNGAAIAPSIPTYTAKPSSLTRGSRAQQSVLDYWKNPNNTGMGAQVTNPDSGGNDNQNKRSTIAKVLDALSVGAYGSAGAQSGTFDKMEEMAKSGDVKVDSLSEVAGLVGAGAKGWGKGVKSAFNDDKKITFKDNVDRFVETGNKSGDFDVDMDSKSYKAGSAAAGLFGDIFADPTTYIPGVGVSKILKVGKGKKIAEEFFGESADTTRFAKSADETPTVATPTTKSRPNVKAQEPINYSDDLVPTGVGKSEKFSGPGIPAQGFDIPDSASFKMDYADAASSVPSISAKVPNPAVGELGKFQTGIDPNVVQSTVEDTLPRKFADAIDSVGTTTKQAAESTASETAAKSAKEVQDVTDEITNLAKVQHNAKNTNPALNKGVKFSDWANHAKAGDYSPEQLQPFFDYHKVDNVDDLIETMKGKNYKATQTNIRAGMREQARKDIRDALPGSAASAADKMSTAGLQAEKLVEGSLDAVKPDLVTFAEPGLAKTVDDSIKRVLDINVRFPSRSEKIKPGVHRRTASKKSGVTYLGSNNIMDQSTAGTKIAQDVVNHFVKTGRKIGPEEVDLVIAAIRRYEQTTSAKGMYPHIGSGKTGTPLGLSDILTALPKDFVRKYLVGNAANKLNFRTLLTTVAEGLKTPAQTADAMRTVLKETMRTMENGLSTKAKSNAFQPAFSKRDGTVIKNRDFVSEEAALDEIADTLTASMNNITEASINAGKLAKVDIGEKIHAVSEGVIKSINDALNAGEDGKAITDLLNSTDMFRKAAKAQGLAPSKVDEVVEAAQKTLADDLNLSPSLINDIEDGAKVSDEMFEPIESILDDLEGNLRVTTDPKKINNVKTVANDAARETFQDGLEMAAKAGNSADAIGDTFDTTAKMKASGFLQGLGRATVGGYGMGGMTATFQNGEQAIRAMSGQFASELTRLQKTIPKEEIGKQFTLFRQGQTGVMDPALEKVFKLAFDGTPNGRMARAGIMPDNFAFFAQKQGIAPEAMPKFGNDNPWTDVSLPVGKDNTPDVLPYLRNLYTAQLETMKYSQMGRGFSASFGRATRPGANWFKPSTSALSDLNKNQLTQFIDPNKYYSKETLDGLSEMNRYIKQMDELGVYGGEKMNNFMNTVKKITGKWKLWQTVVRPGHHFKNQVGDMTLTFLAGHTNPDAYFHAVRMLKTFDKDYRGLDGLGKRMDEDMFGIPSNLDTNGVGKTFKWGNNKFTDEEIHAAAMQENVLTSFYVAEDLSFSGIDKNVKAAKNPVTKTASGIEHVGGLGSEYRDKWVRMTHFVSATRKIAKNNPTWSKSKVYGKAGSEVRKWHPNGTGLSPWENKYAKVGIMFYSWQRQVLPLMLESLALKPGRITVAPKAMYAIAESQGIDLDSFGNPFPADNIYPEFLTDEPYGPNLAGGLGFKPGIPQMDFLGDYGSPKAAGNTAISSINPLAKVPIEFATGQRMGVGENIPISDKSEYIDNNIPLASYANNLTGRSLSSGFTQPTKRAEEDRQPPIGRTLINLLFGGGITDYNDSKFQEIGERDLKERESR